MSSPTSSPDALFGFDSTELTRSAVNGLRVAYGILGAVALILGVVLLVWPLKTAAVFAVTIGIYFLVAAVLRIALGIFTTGISGGTRAFDIILGVVLLVLGIFTLRNVSASSAALLFLIVTLVGIGWIIDGIFAIAQSGRRASRGWSIAYGIVALIAGILVLVVPGWSIVLLVLYGGIVLIVLGIVGLVRAFTLGRDSLQSA